MAYSTSTFSLKCFTFFLLATSISSCASANKSISHNRHNKSDSSSETQLRESITSIAKKMIGIKYKKSGKTPTGFDCSGLVGYVYGRMDMEMAASAASQATEGKKIEIGQVKPGDLIFFGSNKKITHVGIVTENQKNKLSVIHSTSSSGVIEENILLSDYWMKRIHSFNDQIGYKITQPLSLVKK